MNLYIFSDVPLDQSPVNICAIVAENEFTAATLLLTANESKVQRLLERGMAEQRFAANDLFGALCEYFPCRTEQSLCDDQVLFMLMNGLVVAEPKTASG